MNRQASTDCADLHRLKMDKYPFAEFTYQIIGCAMDVHKELGPGFLEAVYHEALAIEMEQKGLLHSEEPEIQIQYKNRVLKKKYIPDFFVEDSVIVEIKALSRLTSIEESQVINYLKAGEMKIGLLINFGGPSLEFRRFINSDGNVSQLE